MVKLAVLASGGGTNLQSIMDAIGSGRLDARISVVVSDNPRAFALERAKRGDIPAEVITAEAFPGREAFNAEIARVLKGYGVELVVLAGFMRIITKAVLDAFPMRVVNIHPSLLPSFPGLDVQKKALEHGVRFSGCTVHFVDEGVDSGPVIAQAVVPVLDDDTPETLSARILAEEHRIYPQAIQLLSEGRLTVKGRRVYVRGGSPSGWAVENPRAEIFEGE
ncbi:MAG: phosphoribosylglycinamide formyltransferase [Thermodesulfobacteriota bacterium]